MQITYHIPVFGVSSDGNAPHPHPSAIFDIFEAHGLGKVNRIDVVPRNSTTPSLEWMLHGLPVESPGLFAFVHCEGTLWGDYNDDINSQALNAIDDDATEFRIDWEQYLTGVGKSYWIINRSTSETPPTAACATYEREQFSGHMTVILRSMLAAVNDGGDDAASPIETRCALYSCGISTGVGVCVPGNDSALRYDLMYGMQCFLNPHASLTGDVGYTEAEFIELYGPEEGAQRFESAPIAAPCAPLVYDPSIFGELHIELTPEQVSHLVQRLAPPLRALVKDWGSAHCFVDPNDPGIARLSVNVPPFPGYNQSFTVSQPGSTNDGRIVRARHMRGIIWMIHTILDEICGKGLVRLSWCDELGVTDEQGWHDVHHCHEELSPSPRVAAF